MPIQLTLPTGLLDAEARSTLQRNLAPTLLKWEGAAGRVVRFAELAKLAAAERTDA